MRWRDLTRALAMVVTATAFIVAPGVADVAGNPTRSIRSDGATPATSAATPTPGDAMITRARGWLDQQLAALDKAREITLTRRTTRHDEYRRRLRATYRLSRPGASPVWLDGDTRAAMATQRSAARRTLARDRSEIAIFDKELQALARSRESVEAERERLDSLDLPAAGSLRNPVARSRVARAFGLYRESQSRALLSRRGVWLSSRPGRNLRAVAPGTVRYAGTARNLGRVVVVDHGDYTSVLGGCDRLAVSRGQRVDTGDILGESRADEVYLEVRLDIGPGGFPVDPEPLIR